MSNFTIEEFSNLIVKLLEDEGKEAVLQNPTTESIFPCSVIRTPIETVLLREGNEVVRKKLSISIEEWADKQLNCMNMLNETEKILKKYNILKTSNDISTYDQITRKYRIINTYETIYNGITNSFDLIK